MISNLIGWLVTTVIAAAQPVAGVVGVTLDDAFQLVGSNSSGLIATINITSLRSRWRASSDDGEGSRSPHVAETARFGEIKSRDSWRDGWAGKIDVCGSAPGRR
jgi:hypothetical protein